MKHQAPVSLALIVPFAYKPKRDIIGFPVFSSNHTPCIHKKGKRLTYHLFDQSQKKTAEFIPANQPSHKFSGVYYLPVVFEHKQAKWADKKTANVRSINNFYLQNCY